ncbi:hypothetical protein VTN77DRAFT_2199 [Rasamsonia byssochlamydoides]|uniref:uncharacterized protein n=1 Tax=Rasamsonia byssochlamydoides TaxID=89139 RepID=UPI00374488A4
MATPLTRVATDKIILFGDSITELSSDQSLGFNLAPALQHEYFRKLQVITRGYGGYNTEHARHILEPILDFETAGNLCKIRLLTIFFGTNDAAWNDHQFVPLDRYRENLRDMVCLAKGRGIPVILIGPGPVDEYAPMVQGSASENGEYERTTLRNREYANAACEVAAETDVPFIDLWMALLRSEGWEEGAPIPGKKPSKGESEFDGNTNTNDKENDLRDLLTDGAHFSGKACRVWFDLLRQTIREAFPELRTENLPTVLPHIFDIDPKDLPGSLWQDVVVKKE